MITMQTVSAPAAVIVCSSSSSRDAVNSASLSSGGRKGCDFRRQFDRARMCVGPVCVERQLTHLRCCGVPHLLAVAVADVDREKAGKGVQVALAFRVLEVAAVATDDDRHIAVPVTAHPREVEPEMVARSALKIQLLRCRGRQFASPTRVPQSYSCLTIWR